MEMDSVVAAGHRAVWVFHSDGTISAAGHDGHVLTFESADDSLPCRLALERLMPASCAVGRRQRWGFKSTLTRAIGQWKLSRGVNKSKKWQRDAFLWPVDVHEQWIAELDVTRLALIASVAWKLESSISESELIKVKVVYGTGRQRELHELRVPSMPRVSKRKQTSSLTLDSQRWLTRRYGDGWAKADMSLEQRNHVLQKAQLELFLASCHDSFGSMPRRPKCLYTAWGDKVRDLEHVVSGQMLTLSCGEAWTPPEDSAASLLKRELETLRSCEETLQRTQIVLLSSQLSLAMPSHGTQYEADVIKRRHKKSSPQGDDDEDAEAPPTTWVVCEHTEMRQLVFGNDLCLQMVALEPGAMVVVAPPDAESNEQKWVVEGSLLTAASNSNLVLGVQLVDANNALFRLMHRDQVRACMHACMHAFSYLLVFFSVYNCNDALLYGSRWLVDGACVLPFGVQVLQRAPQMFLSSPRCLQKLSDASSAGQQDLHCSCASQ